MTTQSRSGPCAVWRAGAACLAMGLAVLPALAPRPAAGQSQGQGQQRSLTIEAGLGRVLALSGPAASVFAADPKVVEVRPASPTSLFVFGIAPGRTTVAALSASGAPIAQWDVVVRPSSYAANEVRGAVKPRHPQRWRHQRSPAQRLLHDRQLCNP